jgi:hypothetical protein
MTVPHVPPRRIMVGPAHPLLSNRIESLLLENLALRQQLAVLKRKDPRPRIGAVDKIFWVFARRFWGAWKQSLVLGDFDLVGLRHAGGMIAPRAVQHNGTSVAGYR